MLEINDCEAHWRSNWYKFQRLMPGHQLVLNLYEINLNDRFLGIANFCFCPTP